MVKLLNSAVSYDRCSQGQRKLQINCFPRFIPPPAIYALSSSPKFGFSTVFFPQYTRSRFHEIPTPLDLFKNRFRVFSSIDRVGMAVEG